MTEDVEELRRKIKKLESDKDLLEWKLDVVNTESNNFRAKIRDDKKILDEFTEKLWNLSAIKIEYQWYVRLQKVRELISVLLEELK